MITADVKEYIEAAIQQALKVRPQPFTPEKQDQLEYAFATLGAMNRDQSLGRILGGPLWLSGTSVIDGTITADKLVVNTLESVTANTGTLNVTGTITAAAAFPATGARITISASGFRAFNSTPTQTVGINVDGSGFLGVGATAITWTTAGVMTIPAATISGLTIADIGAGAINSTFTLGSGQIATATSGTRVFLNSSGIGMYSGSTQTLSMSAATGAFEATGSFTIKSSASGAHITISNAGGIIGYNATSEIDANRTFFLNAATGAGFVGLSPGTIQWTSGGTVSIDGTVITNGTVTATKLSVTELSAISANLGTITAGTVTGATLRTAASGGRVVIDTTGITGYASNGTTERFRLSTTDGSGWVGSSSHLSWAANGLITFAGWTANTTSLIGGSVTLSSAGDVTVGTSNNVVRLSSSDATYGILVGHATAASAPFRVTRAGALTIEGADFTVRTASSGARVEVTGSTGTPGVYIRSGDASSTIRGFLSASGSGFLGSTDGTAGNAAISWNTSGTCIINASAITAGTLNASAISVTNLSASSITTGTLSASRISGGTFDASSMTVTNLSASSITTGTLSASRISGGTLDASSMTVTNLSASSINTGTLNGASVTVTNLSASSITSGTLNVGSLTVSGTFTAANISGGTLAGGFNIGTSTLTLNSTGKIVDADGSYWDQDGITFIATGSQTDTLQWKYSTWSANRPYISLYGRNSSSVAEMALRAAYGNGSTYTNLAATYAYADSSGGIAQITARNSVGVFTTVSVNSATPAISMTVSDLSVLDLQATNRRALFNGYIYPGSGSSQQTTGYFYWDGSKLAARGADIYISNYLYIAQSGNTGSGALPNPTNWIAVKNSAGSTRYIPTFSAPNAWAA